MSNFEDNDTIKNASAWDITLLKRLLPFARPWVWHFAGAVILVLASTAISILMPRVLGMAIDEGVKKSSFENISYYTNIFIVGHIIFFLIAIIRNWLLQYIGQNLLQDLRNKLFSHIQHLPVSYFDKNPVGRLVTRITNDVSNIAELFSAALINVGGQLVLFFSLAVTLLVLNWKLGLATLFLTPLMLWLMSFLKTRLREAFRISRVKLAALNSSLAENLNGVSIIHIFNQEKTRAKKFDDMNSGLRDADLKSVFYNAMFMPISGVFMLTIQSIVLLYGGWLVWTAEITIGLLISYMTYIQSLFEPVRQISEIVTILQSAMASAERVFALLDEPEEPDLEGGREFTALNDKLEFKDLQFSYNPDKKILKGLTFTINKGEKIAVVGHTGAGKTTLASLLKRFYEYQGGQILIDGVELKEFSRTSLRRKIGMIQQDVNIFSGTMLDNIFLEEGTFDQEKLDKIISELKMQPLIDKLDNGIETEIFERGSNISAGQRQLIAFSRALVSDPEILILDEATSSVDSETESIIQQAVQHLTSNRTSLIIAHRLSTIRNCSKILVLHNGQLVEEGSHEALLAKDGYYSKLYEMQFASQTSS